LTCSVANTIPGSEGEQPGRGGQVVSPKRPRSVIISYMAASADPAPSAGSARRQSSDFELHILLWLTRTYCDVCNVTDIDADADLITCGLQSIDAIRIANLAAEEFGAELALDQLLRRPTLRAAAEQLAGARPAGAGNGPPWHSLGIPSRWPPGGPDEELMEEITYSDDGEGPDP
jgi:aryl carrier-like protein